MWVRLRHELAQARALRTVAPTGEDRAFGEGGNARATELDARCDASLDLNA